MDDGTSDFGGTRDDLRNDQYATVWIAMAVTGHFDKPEGVLEQRCALQDLRHLFHTLTNPIADNQQQKPPVSETAVDRVNEGGLGSLVVVEITDMTEQGWRGLLFLKQHHIRIRPQLLYIRMARQNSA